MLLERLARQPGVGALGVVLRFARVQLLDHFSHLLQREHALGHRAAADNDVATFGCIVRSEVDEEFRLVRRAQFIRRNSAGNSLPSL